MDKGNKNVGLFKKYSVTKISNPEKDIDAIVLEFDDPIAKDAIRVWANDMWNAGYEQVARDVRKKLKEIGREE